MAEKRVNYQAGEVCAKADKGGEDDAGSCCERAGGKGRSGSCCECGTSDAMVKMIAEKR